MARDVTGATGQRPASSRRSQTAQFARQEATVESQDFKRRQLALKPASGSAAGAFAGAFGSFFQDMLTEAQAKESADAKEANRQESLRVAAAVNSNRAGAREAMMTGNTEGFISPEFRDNRAIAEAFEALTAQAAAEDDFFDELREQIQGLGPTDDPELFLQEYMKDKMDGGSPTFRDAYGKTLRKAAAREIALFRAHRVTVLEKRAEETAFAVTTLDIQNQEIPVSAAALELMTAKIAASLPLSNGPKRILIAEAIRDKVITRIAAKEGGYALKLMNIPDPDRDGTSIADRNPGAYATALKEAFTTFRSTMSVKALATYDSIEDDLATYAATGEGVIGELYARMQQAGQNFSKHATTWKGLRDKFTRLMAGTAANRGVLDSIANGNASNVGNNVWAKIAPLMNQPATWVAVSKRTGVPVAAVKRYMQREYAVRGPGKAGREANSVTILTSPDHAQVKALFETTEFNIKMRRVRMDDKATGHFSREAFAMVQMMHLAQASGMNPYAERQKFLDRLEKSGGKLKIAGHYRSRLVGPKNEPIGAGGELDMLDAVWDKLDLDDAAGIRKVKGSVRNAVLEAVNMASAMSEGQGKLGDEGIVAHAASLLANNFVMERGADGDWRYTFNLLPPMVLDRHGNSIPGTPLDEDDRDRQDAAMALPENTALADILGGGMGAVIDNDTYRGFGKSVVSNAKGFEEAVSFYAGKKFGMTFDTIPDDFPPSLLAMIKVDEGADADPTGTMFFVTPSAPKVGEPHIKILSDNLFLLYARDTDQWLLRWKDAAAPTTNIAEISARNKARRAEMTAARARPNVFKSTAQGFKGTPAELRDDNPNGFETDPPKQGTTGPIGSPVPEDDSENPPVIYEQKAIDNLLKEIMETLESLNYVGAVAISDESKIHEASSDGATVEERLQSVVDQEQANGGPLNNLSDPQDESFDNTLMDFVLNEEGYRSLQYDDYSRADVAWTPKSKGNPTIGYGFNLKRDDARELLAIVGLDFDKVMARKQQITRIQAEHLYKLAMKPMVTLVRKKYAEARLGNHQIQALASMAYNSKWNESGPTLLGPKLTYAISIGDWASAGWEIAWNSENVHPSVKRGIHLRRMKEAMLFLGPELAKKLDYMQDGYSPETGLGVIRGLVS